MRADIRQETIAGARLSPSRRLTLDSGGSQIDRKRLAAVLLVLLASGCYGPDSAAPTYQAYLVNRYADPLYVTLTGAGDAGSLMYVLPANPSVAAAAPMADLTYIVTGDNHWAPGEITLRTSDCVVLARVELPTGDWTVVIAPDGTTAHNEGAPSLTVHPLRPAEPPPCPWPPELPDASSP
jgi:hypothetical protein